MVQASPRTAVRGSTFVRLLARLADVDASPSGLSLSHRLGQWLDWNQSIALATALDGGPASRDDGELPVFDEGQEAEYARVRTTLADIVRNARELNPSSSQMETGRDYAPFRQRYIVIQRSMQAATGSLRGRFRDMLAGTSPAMARLAELDAAMELVLGPREQAWLGKVPALLERRFEHLRRDAEEGGSDTWLDVFRKDMKATLLAELDVRFQPVDGLLAALRNT